MPGKYLLLLCFLYCAKICGCGAASNPQAYHSPRGDATCLALHLRGGRALVDNAAFFSSQSKSPPLRHHHESQASPQYSPPLSRDDGANYDGGEFYLNDDGIEREISPISESSDLRHDAIDDDDCAISKSPQQTHLPCSEAEEHDSISKGKTTTLQKGDLLNERYAVVCVLGSGAFGTVYSAHDQVSGETVAVKVQRAGHKYSQVSSHAPSGTPQPPDTAAAGRHGRGGAATAVRRGAAGAVAPYLRRA
jgi:hypothetical protein